MDVHIRIVYYCCLIIELRQVVAKTVFLKKIKKTLKSRKELAIIDR